MTDYTRTEIKVSTDTLTVADVAAVVAPAIAHLDIGCDITAGVGLWNGRLESSVTIAITYPSSTAGDVAAHRSFGRPANGVRWSVVGRTAVREIVAAVGTIDGVRYVHRDDIGCDFREIDTADHRPDAAADTDGATYAESMAIAADRLRTVYDRHRPDPVRRCDVTAVDTPSDRFGTSAVMR